MCDLNPLFMRYFSVLHLIAISYERYSAIVNSPYDLQWYDHQEQNCDNFFIWLAPILLSIGPFVGWGQYVYNPEVFSCEQGWRVHSDSSARNAAFESITTLVVPSLIIVFLNLSVFKTASTLQHSAVQVGNLDGSEMSENQLQEISRRMSERKTAVDVCIIIAAFMVCFLPAWTVGLCRQFLRSHKVPAEVILATTGIFFISTLCNPIIYSIRKREFRAGGVKNVFRWMGVQCGKF